MEKVKRFIEVDIFRGIVLIGMIIFHFFYILDYFGIRENEMHEGGWLIFARFVQFGFLGLVGISLALSHKKLQPTLDSKKRFYKKQLRRAFQIFGLGMIISLVTFLFVPHEYVKFGMLHLIGISIFALSFIAGKKYLSLLIGLFIIVTGFWIKSLSTSSLFLSILGLNNTEIYSLDYSPIFPWLGIVAIGITIGHFIYREFKSKFEIKSQKKFHPLRIISFLGRHTLLIYMIHIPLIILTLFFIK